jgi:hypothetical protein
VCVGKPFHNTFSLSRTAGKDWLDEKYQSRVVWSFRFLNLQSLMLFSRHPFGFHGLAAQRGRRLRCLGNAFQYAHSIARQCISNRF